MLNQLWQFFIMALGSYWSNDGLPFMNIHDIADHFVHGDVKQEQMQTKLRPMLSSLNMQS